MPNYEDQFPLANAPTNVPIATSGTANYEDQFPLANTPEAEKQVESQGVAENKQAADVSHEALVQKYIQNAKDTSLFGGGAIDTAILKGANVWGIGDWLQDKNQQLAGASPEERAAAKEGLARMEGESPTASTIGDVTKFGLETYLGGELGKGAQVLGTAAGLVPEAIAAGAGASTAAKIVNIAARGGAFGVGMSLPETVGKLIDGDLTGAAESMGSGAVLGSLFDLGAGGIKSILGKGLEAIKPSASTFLEAGGLGAKGIAENLPQEADKTWAENLYKERMGDNFADKTTAEKGKFWEAQHKESMNDMSKIAKDADKIEQPDIVHNVEPVTPPVSKGQYIADAIKTAGNADKSITDAAAKEWEQKFAQQPSLKSSLGPKLQETLDALKPLADATTGRAEQAFTKDALGTIEDKIKQIAAGKTGAFAGTQELSKYFADAVRESKGAEKILNTTILTNINKTLDDSLEKALTAGGKAEDLAAFKKAQQTYRLTSILPFKDMQTVSKLPFINPTMGSHTGGIASIVGHKLIGGGIGAAAGAALGGEHKKETALIGGLAGFGASMVGGRLLKSWWQDKGAFKAISALRNMDSVAPLTVLQGMNYGKSAIYHVPNLLEAMKNKTTYNMGDKDHDPITALLGDGANGLSKEQQYQKLVKNVTMMTTNPAAYEAHKQDLLSVFSQYPSLQAALNAHFDRVTSAINAVIPKAGPTQAFQKTPETPKPTAKEMDDVKNVIRLMQDPHALLQDFADNKITAKNVALVAQTHPTLLTQLQNEFQKNAYSGHYNLDYQQRLAASIIMGGPMDKSMTMVPALQSVSALPTATPNTGTGKGGSRKGSKEGAASYATSREKNLAQ